MRHRSPSMIYLNLQMVPLSSKFIILQTGILKRAIPVNMLYEKTIVRRGRKVEAIRFESNEFH